MQENIKLIYLAWLEIPYYIGVNYESVFPVDYKPDLQVQLKIKFRNDLVRISTSNRWERSKNIERYIQNGLEIPLEKIRIPRYVVKADLPHIEELVKSQNLPYLHIDEVETVVELSFELEITKQVYDSAIRNSEFISMFSSLNFFNNVVLPKIASVVDIYRVATLPAIRYTVHPVSEGLINTAFIQLQDSTGKIIEQWTHGFDIRNHNRGMQQHVDNLGVQSRFDCLKINPGNIEFELQFCSSYYLFHMRRWAEAITIASGIADSLVQAAVFRSSNESIARLLWDKYRTQTKDLFNRILPALGYSKLEEVDNDLWKSFLKAKEVRGSAAHGSIISSFSSDQEMLVKKHLNDFYRVSRWLSLQIERPWALDIEADGELLQFF